MNNNQFGGMNGNNGNGFNNSFSNGNNGNANNNFGNNGYNNGNTQSVYMNQAEAAEFAAWRNSNYGNINISPKLAHLKELGTNTVAITEQNNKLQKSFNVIDQLLGQISRVTVSIDKLIAISKNRAIKEGNTEENSILDGISSEINALVLQMNRTAGEINVFGGASYNTTTMYPDKQSDNDISTLVNVTSNLVNGAERIVKRNTDTTIKSTLDNRG